MNNPLENNPAPYQDEFKPDLADYKRVVQEKDRIQQILKKKVKELERLNNELEEFAHVASHDLQEPLRKIAAFSERLKETLPDNLNPDVQLYLSRMLSAAENMRLMIDNLLDFSQSTKYRGDFIPTDLNEVIRAIRADLSVALLDTTITCSLLPVIDGVPEQLTQLFTKILSNAIKFKKSGQDPQIVIQARKLHAGDIEIFHLNDQETFFEISVTDKGIGFEQEYSEKILQLFQRLHGKNEYPGSGIGLAICKKIVENHQGIFHASGEPGKGASFYIILPQFQTDYHG